jgi:hypothetical protein
MRALLADLKMYGRFAMGLGSFLRTTISLEEAQEIVRRQMAERETNFLHIMERGIYGYSQSPYLPLLRLAGCELGDIQHMVRSKGLESTLCALRKAGIYITFEEFKGRKPIERNGDAIHVQARHFDNPYLKRSYQATTGGTTGAGTRVPLDLDHMADRTPPLMLFREAHGLLHAPMVVWRCILPDESGIGSILRAARYGQVAQKWFTPITNKDVKIRLKNRLATRSIIAIGRFFGTRLPRPEPVSLDKAAVVARWVGQALKAEGKCLIGSPVSMAVRVCLAAREEGLDLTGAAFAGGGEPPTPAKVKEITRTGARWIPDYFFIEAGVIGLGCARPNDGSDMHFIKDALALIKYPRSVPGSQKTVEAFHYTTLLPTAPKLMLNVESDDYGVIEKRSCGCPLESYGFTEHLRDIRSFRKLTGEGVTLVGSEMLHILEEVLPARFGGSP